MNSSVITPCHHLHSGICYPSKGVELFVLRTVFEAISHCQCFPLGCRAHGCVVCPRDTAMTFVLFIFSRENLVLTPKRENGLREITLTKSVFKIILIAQFDAQQLL